MFGHERQRLGWTESAHCQQDVERTLLALTNRENPEQLAWLKGNNLSLWGRQILHQRHRIPRTRDRAALERIVEHRSHPREDFVNRVRLKWLPGPRSLLLQFPKKRSNVQMGKLRKFQVGEFRREDMSVKNETVLFPGAVGDSSQSIEITPREVTNTGWHRRLQCARVQLQRRRRSTVREPPTRIEGCADAMVREHELTADFFELASPQLPGNARVLQSCGLTISPRANVAWPLPKKGNQEVLAYRTVAAFAQYGFEPPWPHIRYSRSPRSMAAFKTSQSIRRLRPIRRNPFAVSSFPPLIQ